MSILSFLKNIWDALTGKNKKIANISYDIVEAIKKVDDTHSSPMDIVLAVIPEKLKEKFTDNVISILYNAGLITTRSLTPDEAVLEAAVFIKKIKGSLNHKVGLNSLFIFVASVLADGKIGWDDLVHLGPLVWKKRNEQSLEGELSGNDTDGDGIDDWEDEDADGDGENYLTDPNDPRHGRP